MCVQAMVLSNPSALSASELHELLLKSHAAGNRQRRIFIDCLRMLEDSRLYLQLGFPSLAAYSETTFHYGRTQTYEFVRISRALEGLPRIGRAFERGEISLSLVGRLIRVATEETEEVWLEHLQKHTRAQVDLEIRDAEKKGRKRPRKDGYGLPGLPVRVTFEFSPEEHAVVTQGIKKITEEMAQGLGGARPEPKAALLYLFQRIVETDPAGSIPGGREERERSAFAVVYHSCPNCLAATVETDAGRVKVSREALERAAAHAEAIHLRDALAIHRTGHAAI